MAQIGYGYGSEWQLLRYLGHHRELLNKLISDQTGVTGEFRWLDFGFADENKSISRDDEIKGISFLRDYGLFTPVQYQKLEAEYKSYKIGNIDNWQSWDAILVAEGTIFLVEAKAYPGEMVSNNNNGGNSANEILRYMAEQLPDFQVTNKWLDKYYQFANRLATTALLNNNEIKAKTMYIYFVNGYNRRVISKGGKITSIGNKNTSRKAFETAISDELKELGIQKYQLDKYLTPPVFIVC